MSHEHTDAIKSIAAVGIMISHIAEQIKFNVRGPTMYYVLLCTTLGGIDVNLFFFASEFGNYYFARKLIGNTFLMASMLIVVKNFHIDNCIARRLGNVSIEIYLIHISPSVWFLRNRVPGNIGIIQAVLWTAIEF